jgi:hypothetical protein
LKSSYQKFLLFTATSTGASLIKVRPTHELLEEIAEEEHFGKF